MAKSQLKALTASLLLATALSGCTTHLTAKPEAAGETGPSYGIPYRLPVKQFAVTVTWELEKCLTGTEMRNEGHSRGQAGLRFKVKPEYTTDFLEGESIVMDYRLLTNRFKTGELTVDYWAEDDKRQTRFVKSINGTIEGREAEALKSGIETVTNIAKTVLMLSGKVPTGATSDTPVIPEGTSCNDDAVNALAALATLDAELKTLTEKAGKLTLRVDVLKARVTLGKLGKTDREYETLVAEIDALTKKREDIEANIKRIRTALSYTETFHYPSKPMESAAAERLKANPKKAEAWLKSLLRPDLQGLAATEAAALAIDASLTPLAGETGTIAVHSPSCGEDNAACLGYVYREPAAARLRLAGLGQQLGPNGAPQLREEVLSEKIESIPQIGRVRVLPLRSRWGEKNGLSADFAKDGTPIKISYKAIEAGGPRMAAAASSASASALDIATLIAKGREAEEKEEKGAQAEALAALKLEVEILENQRKLAALQAGSGDDLAQVKAEIDLVENRKKLANLLGAPPEEVTALNAELAILRLQKEKAELEAAIREANES